VWAPALVLWSEVAAQTPAPGIESLTVEKLVQRRERGFRGPETRQRDDRQLAIGNGSDPAQQPATQLSQGQFGSRTDKVLEEPGRLKEHGMPLERRRVPARGTVMLGSRMFLSSSVL
jgi:hypothetical protein